MPKIVIGERKPPSFFSAGWQPEKLDVFFPNCCPHCGEKATKRRGYSTARGTGATTTHVIFQVPVCDRVLPSVLTYLAIVFFSFLTVCFGLAVSFSILEGIPIPALIGLSVALGGLVWAIRAHTWFRLISFDLGSVTVRVRRDDYAAMLKKLNG